MFMFFSWKMMWWALWSCNGHKNDSRIRWREVDLRIIPASNRTSTSRLQTKCWIWIQCVIINDLHSDFKWAAWRKSYTKDKTDGIIKSSRTAVFRSLRWSVLFAGLEKDSYEEMRWVEGHSLINHSGLISRSGRALPNIRCLWGIVSHQILRIRVLLISRRTASHHNYSILSFRRVTLNERGGCWVLTRKQNGRVEGFSWENLEKIITAISSSSAAFHSVLGSGAN